jgi:hypothetical protein
MDGDADFGHRDGRDEQPRIGGRPMKNLCVFCGSSTGRLPVYEKTAIALGNLLAREGIGLVYGGASVGLMGAVADAVLSAGGRVIGVIPQHLLTKEIAHQSLPDLRVVGSMHERKALMADLSDGFIALPGGFGTFEEFFEVLTWAQLGLHQKPIGLLNIQHYYSPLLTMADRTVEEGFVQTSHRTLLLSSETPEDLLQQFRDYQPIALPKWMKTKET